MAKTKANSDYPYTMEDLRKATKLKHLTFQTWKAQNKRKLERGLTEPSIRDPRRPNRKLFSQEYFERVLALRSKVRTAPNGDQSYTVKLKPNQREAFETVSQLLGWTAKKNI